MMRKKTFVCAGRMSHGERWLFNQPRPARPVEKTEKDGERIRQTCEKEKADGEEREQGGGHLYADET